MFSITEAIYSFLVYSLIGWLLEVSFESVRQGRPVNRGFLNGPFCVIYGFGALIMIFFTRATGASPAAIFVFGAVFLSLLEYLAGSVMEVMFGARWWDYSDQPLNIGGHVSVIYSLLWGFAGLIAMELVQPKVSYLVDEYLSVGYGIAISLIIVAYFLTDLSISLASSVGLKSSLSRMKADMPMVGDKEFVRVPELAKEIRSAIAKRMPKLPFGQRRILAAFPDLSADIARRWAEGKKRVMDRISG